MFGTTITIKFQNKLAREAILDRLKSKSKYMFEDGGLIFRSFLSVTDTQVEIFHVFKDKDYALKERSAWTDQFWQDIKEMGGSVSRVTGECEVEYSDKMNLENFIKIM